MRFFLKLNDGGYDYQLLCLAQGLAQLGHEVFSSRPYWRDVAGGFLTSDSASPFDCDWVLMQAPCNRALHGDGLDDVLLKQHPRTIFVDTADGLVTASFDPRARKASLILKQMTRCITYPGNCRAPWAFGLSQELCDLPQPSWECRSRWIEVNHRNVHGARLRATSMLATGCNARIGIGRLDDSRLLSLDFPALLGLNAEAAEGRHERRYLDRLRSVQACLTVGGYFTGPRSLNDTVLGRRLLASAYVPGGGRLGTAWKAIGLPTPHLREVFQWDSWRFWETFAAGAVNVNFDLEAYGVQLPVMPVNWMHYVGLDFGAKWNETLERFLGLNDEQLRSIAAEGRSWAALNYSPRATAHRLLGLIR